MSWPAKMDLTPQRGAFSRVLNRLARNTKIVFSPELFVCRIILEIQIFAWRTQHLRTPCGHLEGWSGWILLFDASGSRWCQAHTALWVDLLHWGPDERFPSFAEEPNKAIFRCLPRPWNKAEKIAVVNSFSSVGNQQRSCSRRTAPITVASPTWSLHQDER